jgi:hypothetical protein
MKLKAALPLMLSMLTACNYGPAPMKCDECAPLCHPFYTARCIPVQAYESGKIAYVRCECGETVVKP